MNRHQRRAARAKREGDFYQNYIQQLPEVPMEAPLERGRLYHTVCHHDPWCAIYDTDTGGLGQCNCNVVLTRHIEPRRS
jgi:hypothetical protein